MAKGNLFLGKAKGKVGSVVFSVLDGEQITRSMPASVTNPRTYGQNVQRAIFATVAKAAAAMNDIVDHSYANVTYGPDSVRYFRKLNLDKLRSLYLNNNYTVAMTPKGGGFVPNDYIIAKGALPSFDVFDTDGSFVNFQQGGAAVTPGVSGMGWTQFKQAYPYILPGDQLTVCSIVKVGNGSLNDNTAGFTFRYERIVLNPSESALAELAFVINDSGFNPNACDLTRTTNTAALRLTTYGAGSWLGLGVESPIVSGVYAVALIQSRLVNNTWQRSTTSFKVINADDIQDVEYAITTYDGSTDSITSDTEYLNQAVNSEASIAGVSGPYLSVVGFPTGIVNVQKGMTASGGNIELSSELSINATAYGTEDNPLLTLELSGTASGEEYFDYKQAKKNTSSLTFSPGDDGNFVGSYTFTALFKDKTKAEVTFILSVPE